MESETKEKEETMSDVIARNVTQSISKPLDSHDYVSGLDNPNSNLCDSPTSSNSSLALPASTATNTETKMPKICAVCGDKALGYNFGAMTCESCKAFFRRNALSNKELKCPFENACEVTQVTRRFCQRCRLKKCCDIGMKKEYILTQEQKDDKRRKIEENRQKKSEQLKRKKTLELDNYDPEGSQQQIQLPLVQSTDSTLYHSSDGPTIEKVYRIETPSTSSSIHHLPCNLNSSNANSPNVPSPIGAEIHHTTSEGYAEVGMNHISPEKESAYTFEQTQHNIKVEHGYPSHYNIPPVVFIPSTTSQVISTSEVAGTTNDNHSNTTSSSPIQIQNVGTIITENDHILQNSSIASAPKYIDCHAPSCTNSTINSNIYPHHSHANAIDTNDSSNGQYGNTFNPLSELHQLYRFIESNDVQILDRVVSVAIKAEFHTNKSIKIKGDEDKKEGEYDAEIDNANGRSNGVDEVKELNFQEKARLHELYEASRSLSCPLEQDKDLHASATAEPNNLISVINLTDLAIKRIIKMAKQISPFINMCQEDQIALLKGGCTELMILRSIISYNPEKNSWSLPSNRPHRELRMDVLKQANDYGVQLYEEHQRFVKSFDARWRSDENVMLLLSAIALFTPERSNVLHKDVVKLEQDTYYFLLRRYLDTVCSNGCESRSAYLNLIGKLQDLHRLNESHIQLFLEVDPQCVEPLLIEIFDLNPNGR